MISKIKSIILILIIIIIITSIKIYFNSNDDFSGTTCKVIAVIRY